METRDEEEEEKRRSACLVQKNPFVYMIFFLAANQQTNPLLPSLLSPLFLTSTLVALFGPSFFGPLPSLDPCNHKKNAYILI
jgi:hypothetical protein